ncbi:MAG: alpha/beta hydrolase [Deltaproteobacteria bacterium]|nr:alpha/beta hydrolase [Deltaproteobacteria bacterium]
MAEYFTQTGYAVTAFDLRGHGQSGGQRGHTPSYENLMKDISQFLNLSGEYFPDTPALPLRSQPGRQPGAQLRAAAET